MRRPLTFAFLRAINVGGHTVTMERLRRIFGAMGLKEVETFIASGNVVFATPSTNPRVLAAKIEDRLHASLGYEVKTFLRSEKELAAIATYRPFTESRRKTAAAFCVGFLAEPLEKAAVTALLALRTANDDFHVHDREVYWLCKKKQSESTFSNALFEKTVTVRATLRGMNTVERLAAKYALADPPPARKAARPRS